MMFLWFLWPIFQAYALIGWYSATAVLQLTTIDSYHLASQPAWKSIQCSKVSKHKR